MLLLYFSVWAVNLKLGQANTSKLAATFSEPHRKDFIVVVKNIIKLMYTVYALLTAHEIKMAGY